MTQKNNQEEKGRCEEEVSVFLKYLTEGDDDENIIYFAWM